MSKTVRPNSKRAQGSFLANYLRNQDSSRQNSASKQPNLYAEDNRGRGFFNTQKELCNSIEKLSLQPTNKSAKSPTNNYAVNSNKSTGRK